MMKKLFIIVLAALVLFSLSACKSKTEAPETEKKETAVSEGVLKENVFKAGVIYSGDPAAGEGESWSHDLGIAAMQGALGLDDGQIVRKINVTADDLQNAVDECVNRGCEIIFVTDEMYLNAAAELAEKYPDAVLSCVGTGKKGGSNFNCYYGGIYQGFYLCGVAAGMQSQAGTLGFISSSSKQARLCADAFAMGAERVNPDVTVELVEAEAGMERACAEELFDRGCDVIAQHCESAEPVLVAVERELWACGCNRDLSEEASGAFLTAPMWNWGVYYTRAAKAVMEKAWTNENYYGVMADGFIDMCPISENSVDAAKEAVDEVRSAILGGEEIFSGEIVDNCGRLICPAEASLDKSAVENGADWYYKNIQIVQSVMNYETTE